MKYIKSMSWFMGVSMFMFGVLKFFHPFKGWYTAQVYKSGLDDISYAVGIAGEIAVGVCLIFAMLYQSKFSERTSKGLISVASGVAVVMMAMAFYVHFHPDVPGDVLPLKIKPPFIPGMFMLMAMINIFLVNKKQSFRKASL